MPTAKHTSARSASILSQRAPWNINPPSIRQAADALPEICIQRGCIFLINSPLPASGRRRHMGSKQAPKSLIYFFQLQRPHARSIWRLPPSVGDESIPMWWQGVTKPNQNTLSSFSTERLLNAFLRLKITIFLRLRWFQSGVAAALGGFVYKNIFRVEVVAFLLFVDTHPLFILKRREKNLCCWMLQIITLLSYTVLNPFLRLLAREEFLLLCRVLVYDHIWHLWRERTQLLCEEFSPGQRNVFSQNIPIVYFQHSRCLKLFKQVACRSNQNICILNLEAQKTIMDGYIFLMPFDTFCCMDFLRIFHSAWSWNLRPKKSKARC